MSVKRVIRGHAVTVLVRKDFMESVVNRYRYTVYCILLNYTLNFFFAM